MASIHIMNYNNYYNRQFKRESTLADYILDPSPAASNIFTFHNINFNRRDGIDTTLVVNIPTISTEPDPDYLIVAETSNIISRWFVTESTWNRDHQLVLTLHRDVLVDFYDDFKLKKFYCEKGPIPSGYENLVYNDEGMTFNQILKSRELLLPTSGASKRTYVIYTDKTKPIGKVYYGDIYKKYATTEECPLEKVRQGSVIMLKRRQYGVYKRGAVASVYVKTETTADPMDQGTGYFTVGELLGDNIYNIINTGAAGSIYPYIQLEGAGSGIATALIGDLANEGVMNQILTEFWEKESAVDYDNFSEFDGKVIQIEDQLYTVSITVGNTDTRVMFTPSTSLYASARTAMLGGGHTDLYVDADVGHGINNFTVGVMGKACSVTLTAVSASDYVDITTPGHIDGIPYDILYAEEANDVEKFCSYLASQFIGANVIYDIQLLPFSPTGTGGTSINLPGGSTLKWATADNIHGTFYHSAIGDYSTSLKKKQGAIMDLCRIYGPDGATCWEFNPSKIGGVAKNSIKYEVTFAPITPYIHIFPTFGGIYGSVNRTYTSPLLGESRGLICSGDYSIPYSTNNWATYKLQNSAYQLAHDRQIRNMAVNQMGEMWSEEISTWTGMISGALKGGMAAGVPGAAVGMIGSAAASTFTRGVNDALRAEEMSYAEDMFGYQLQNIRAQAQPLAHSNFITIGVSYFPFIEYYSSTTIEGTILENRLLINGCSLGIVTTVNTMMTAIAASGTLSKFFKGSLVEFGGAEDAHIAAAVNAELQKGVRLRES